MPNYPTSLDDATSLPNPTDSENLDAPDHADLHTTENEAIIAIESKLGIGSSMPVASNFLVCTANGSSSWDKTVPLGDVVGDSDSQTLTNKDLSNSSNTFPTFTAAETSFDPTDIEIYGFNQTDVQSIIVTIVEDFATEITTLQKLSNLSTDTTMGGSNPSNTLYPSQKAVNTFVGNSISGLDISQYAIDTTVVHLANTETITGYKTFQPQVNIGGANNEHQLIIKANSAQTQDILHVVGTDSANTLVVDRYGRITIQTTASAGTQAGLTMQDTVGNNRFSFFNNGSTYFEPIPATSSSTSNNSPELNYYTSYWNGSASVSEGFRFTSVRLSATQYNQNLTLYNTLNTPIFAWGTYVTSVGYPFPGGQTAASLGNLFVQSVAVADNTIVAKGVASQTGNLFETRNSSNTKLAKIDASGLFYPVQAPTASAPSYVKGALYFDTTLNKLRIGGASGWETVTSS